MADLTSCDDLHGKLLIAMPGMGDPRFEKSVVYLCAHSDRGAMGLIVNKIAPELRFADLLQQLDIAPPNPVHLREVHYGGPVEHGRGFVLHSDDYSADESTLHVEDGFAMTATLEVLEDIASGMGPRRAMLALGYAGWGAGQLEAEIAQNAWLVCDATEDLVFNTDSAAKWSAALRSLGAEALTLSAAPGHA